MSDGIQVFLTPDDVVVCERVAVRRRSESEKAGLVDRSGSSRETYSAWTKDLLGATGELAVARALGLQWNGDVNTFHAPDLDGMLQVRATTYEHGSLIHRERDNPDDLYVLAICLSAGLPPGLDTSRFQVWVVRGWIHGHGARRREWFGDKGTSRDSCWWVPQQALHPMSELPR